MEFLAAFDYQYAWATIEENDWARLMFKTSPTLLKYYINHTYIHKHSNEQNIKENKCFTSVCFRFCRAFFRTIGFSVEVVCLSVWLAVSLSVWVALQIDKGCLHRPGQFLKQVVAVSGSSSLGCAESVVSVSAGWAPGQLSWPSLRWVSCSRKVMLSSGSSSDLRISPDIFICRVPWHSLVVPWSCAAISRQGWVLALYALFALEAV